jgi:hypothetical protein
MCKKAKKNRVLTGQIAVEKNFFYPVKKGDFPYQKSKMFDSFASSNHFYFSVS